MDDQTTEWIEEGPLKPLLSDEAKGRAIPRENVLRISIPGGLRGPELKAHLAIEARRNNCKLVRMLHSGMDNDDFVFNRITAVFEVEPLPRYPEREN